VSAPEVEQMRWTPWVTIVCERASCRAKVKRAWPPGQPPPRYCDRDCKRKENRARSKRSQSARKRAGEPLGKVVMIEVQCARPGCNRTGTREWHTATDVQPRHCSPGCARRALSESYRSRRDAADAARCEHPRKLAYNPTEPGLRRAARDAVRYEKYVYACRCFRLHLTSDAEQGAPLTCVDHRLSFEARRAAWYEHLLPIAQQLRERRWRKS
jgi:hypothetical protein